MENVKRIYVSLHTIERGSSRPENCKVTGLHLTDDNGENVSLVGFEDLESVKMITSSGSLPENYQEVFKRALVRDFSVEYDSIVFGWTNVQ